MASKTNIGNDVLVHVEPIGPRIVLSAGQGSIELEPAMFLELLRFAEACGWGRVLARAAQEMRAREK